MKNVHVGLLIERTRAYGRRVCEGIASYASSCPDVTLDMLAWDEFRGLRKENSFDAFIVRVLDEAMAEKLVMLGKPTVDVYYSCRRPGFATVDLDNEAIANLVFEHFRERGFRNFGYCGYDGIRFSDVRREAFIRAASAAGECFSYTTPPAVTRQFADDVVRNERYSPSARENGKLMRWIRSVPKPIAVFCSHDLRAYQLLKLCRTCGIAVPDQVAIVGCDDDPILCELTTPALTSVDPDGYAVGRTAVEVAVKMVRDRRFKSSPPVRLIPSRRICVRASSEVYPIQPSFLSDALVFIRRHCREGIGASDVFAHLGRAHTHVEAAFRKVLGTTVQKAIVNARLDEAQHLLRETNLSVSEIARQSGFSSSQYFCRVFRAVRGCAPAAVRGA